MPYPIGLYNAIFDESSSFNQWIETHPLTFDDSWESITQCRVCKKPNTALVEFDGMCIKCYDASKTLNFKIVKKDK